MKILLCYILLLLSIGVKSQHKVSNYEDVILERSIEDLNNILSKSTDEAEKELIENYVLIKDDGHLIDNKYFNVHSTKKINENNLNENMLCNKKNLFKVFKLIKKEGLKFLKVSIKRTENHYYVFFETMWATKTKDNDIYFKRYNTLAMFLYNYDNDKKDFYLAETELFRH
ncbi:hypothetical protein [Chryseobacterium sp. BIGb0232]|uniref:hypothetical protein n=1 Tax=Chryseobacterium sp. BIGb0232 TaxID=2940598 RepID=UPI000F463712|nr:hypothetical protein [Chryseobacterium sp. BIGb0232]MCS4301816.1 hypothetical protein [Chryseobacterium sp. BIGb0232]ROS19332.1 hypothetical protein EDF65_0015 [Chryseobacterium nakagawai]